MSTNVTGPRPDPFLAEVAKALPDVDVVAIPVPAADQAPAPLDGDAAVAAARTAVSTLVDTVVGMWEVLFPAAPPPEQIRLQWFTHPTGDDRWVTPQAWSAHRLDEQVGDLATGAAELEDEGWTVISDDTAHGHRLRARNGQVRAEIQCRTEGLVLLRAHSSYLSLGRLSAELVARGTDGQAWP